MEMLAWARSYDAYPEPVFVVDMDAIDDAFFRWLNERTDTSWVCPFADFAVIVWEESNDGAFGRFPDGPYGAWSVYRSGLTGWRSPTTVRGHQRGKGVPLRQLRLVRR
jgi:hypothetical protein